MGDSVFFTTSSKVDEVSVVSAVGDITSPQRVSSESRESVVATSPEASLEAAPQTDLQETTSLRILVVDDVASNRKLLVRLVKKHGHIVDDAVDGRDAVEKVAQAVEEGWMYDAILMDHEMPNLKGPEATQEIRAMGCGTLIVGITGNVLAEDVNHFKSCGANHVLPKPVDFRKVEELLVDNGVYRSASPDIV